MKSTHSPSGVCCGGQEMEGAFMAPTSVSRYKYNSKELQTDFGLGLYDYGARFYDPSIGRFHAVDPMAEVYAGVSTLAYVLNNPIRFIDPDGMRVSLFDRMEALGANHGADYEETEKAEEQVDPPTNILRTIANAVNAFWQSLGFGKDEAPSTSATLTAIDELGERIENAADAVFGALPGYASLISQVTGEVDEVGIAGDVLGFTPVGMVDEVAKVAGKTGTIAFKHIFKYDDRVRMRAVQDPVSHNFPYSFDDDILSTQPILKSNGIKIFQQSGTMNGKKGVFEIGLTKEGIIDHRFFMPYK